MTTTPAAEAAPAAGAPPALDGPQWTMRWHRWFDGHLVDPACVEYVLRTWLDNDRDAIALLLLDRTIFTCLYMQYRVKKELPLSAILSAWSRHLPHLTLPPPSSSTPTSPTPSSSSPPLHLVAPSILDSHRRVPHFGGCVESTSSEEFSHINPALLTRMAETRFVVPLSDEELEFEYAGSHSADMDPNSDKCADPRYTLTNVPANVTVLHVTASIIKPIRAGLLPSSLRVLEFAPWSPYNHPFGAGVLPTTLEELWLGCGYNQRFDHGTLPSSLRVLSIVSRSSGVRWRHDMDRGVQYNQPFEPGVLPPALHTLHLGGAFNHAFAPNALPASLRVLTFDHDSQFNCDFEANVLPPLLEELQLGACLQQQFTPGVLPPRLRKLGVERARYTGYNQPFDPDVLPSSLEELDLLTSSSGFNQPFVRGSLPAGLRVLRLGHYYEHPFRAGVLPPRLEELTVLGSSHNDESTLVLPPSVRKLHLDWAPLEINALPASLDEFIGRLRRPATSAVIWPAAVRWMELTDYMPQGANPGDVVDGDETGLDVPLASTLSVLRKWSHPLHAGVLPSTLDTLYLSVRFTFDILPGVLPASLRVLSLESCFQWNKPLGVGVLPASLEELKLRSSRFNHPLGVGVLPPSLTVLELGDCFNHPIEVGVLPPRLRVLAFGHRFKQAIKLSVLPSSLQRLYFGFEFDLVLHGVLPCSLEVLTVACKWYDVKSLLRSCTFPPCMRELRNSVGYKHAKPLPFNLGYLPGEYSEWEYGRSLADPATTRFSYYHLGVPYDHEDTRHAHDLLYNRRAKEEALEARNRLEEEEEKDASSSEAASAITE